MGLALLVGWLPGPRSWLSASVNCNTSGYPRGCDVGGRRLLSRLLAAAVLSQCKLQQTLTESVGCVVGVASCCAALSECKLHWTSLS